VFDRLNVVYAHIHEGLLSWIPPYLAEMGEILDCEFYHDRLPKMIFPLLTCKAVGGEPEKPEVMRCATAILASLIGVHILDDIGKRNHHQSPWQKVGKERAAHYAFAFQAVSDQLWVSLVHDGDVTETVYQSYRQGMMIGLAGRNRSYAQNTCHWEDYWKTVEMTEAQPSGHLAAVGAMLAAADEPFIEDCRGFGHHLGLAQHILKEYEHLWKPDRWHPGRQPGMSLPLAYALKHDHPDRAELAGIVQQDQMASHQRRVADILRAINVEDYLLWAAMQERQRALEALAHCPEQGKQLLEDYLMSCFERIPTRVREEEIEPSDHRRLGVPAHAFDPGELSSSRSILSYQSIVLGLRNQLRQTPLEQNEMS
jgi:geranylgeranyl pyrophosphate synthase